MTDDPQWHNEGGHEWLDSAAYSAYKGRTVDLTTGDGFGEFSYDNFFEVMDRYPDLGGFWIDNDNAYWESHNLYAQVYQKRPDYTLSNNNEDTPIMDMISNEQKTGMSPSYDYPQAVYTAAPRLIEADFKLPSTGALVVHRLRSRRRPQAHPRPAHHQRRLLGEGADGRDADGQRQTPGQPGDVQQLRQGLSRRHRRVAARHRGRRLHVRRPRSPGSGTTARTA